METEAQLGTFRLEIRLGNEAMRSASEVAEALQDVARQLIADPWRHPRMIRDENGNTVGSWTVEP